MTTGSPTRPHRIDVPALDRQIECREDETLFAAARRAGLRIVGACGGRGSCGSCIVRVTEGRVHREGEGAHRKWLRACCLQPRSDLTLEVAPRSLAPIVRADVRTGGEEAPLPLEPSLTAIELTLPPATLQDLASDADRLRRGLAAQTEPIQPITIDWAAGAALPSALRQHGWQVQARLRQTEPGGPLTVASVARPGAPLLGLAVDLGTTNAAAFLVDLATGRRLASLGLENPQVAWGADLISRINHAIKEPDTAEALRRAAVGAIQSLAHDLTRAVGAAVTDIADAVVCGNTAMQHLLAGWPVAQLGRAPFVAATLESVDVAADRLGLALGPGAALHLAPSIGGFVGGDHVTALLATEAIWQQPGVTLVMDIGTNTEISLVHDGAILSASCPSGPALEGGHIGSGMRAAEGAIERVEVVDNALRLQVIGGGVPVGLCGSGVLDALAAFVGAGWIEARGRIVAGRHACIAEVDGVRAITLAEETEERHRLIPAVRFSQHDVRAVQLAKSAIRTGVKLLCAEAGLDESQIHRFVIAGAFGAYIRIESARAIGLLPPLPLDRFQQVGNAAGLGVQQMLSSRERRARAAQIARQARYVELSTRSDFQKSFLQHIGFGS
ncbi:MAG TPA: ASKHA domain-containing protein [Burkholderiaceae bacterium]|nr:ASKHA domain-containing protein [Burkholderiaceae bacterium]